MLKKFQDMGKLLKQAKEMKTIMANVQNELRATKFSVTKLDGQVKVVINGDLQVLEVGISDTLMNAGSKAKLQQALQDAISEGIKKAKDLATSKLSALSGGMMG